MVNLERQKHILEVLKEKKSATVADLAQILYVSEATIRRDLTEMKATGLIERSHGGASLPDNADEISIFVRMEKNAREKDRAALAAIEHLPPFKSVFIDSSSTALALAEKLDLTSKTVVTNNLQTAIRLAKKPNINLVLLGGNIQFNTISTTGSWTTNQLDDFVFDLMLTSCAAVIDGATFERSLEQKEIKKAAFKKCAIKFLIADHTKFSAFATYRLTGLEDYDYIATDVEPDESLVKKCQESGTKLIF